jgi:hypothetical protein
VASSLEALEHRIDDLRGAIRQAVVAGDRAQARELRTELRRAEHAWEEALADLETRRVNPEGPLPTGSLLPVREQVHHALTLLSVPAAPRLIVAVNVAFFAGDVASTRLTSLRRDEERSFRSAPNARPYYLCPALSADRLAPARALLSVSTWNIADRLVGPLSPRVHFLTSAIRVAEAVERMGEPPPEARRLLWRFAANVPGGGDGGVSPDAVARAARAELVIHEEADRESREAAAWRAERLTDVQRLFGVRLAAVSDRDGVGDAG